MPTEIMGPPARHGKARAYAVINDQPYKLRKLKRNSWRLVNTATGASYTAGRMGAGLYCSCPDSTWRNVRCKHLGALLALGLVARPRKAVADV